MRKLWEDITIKNHKIKKIIGEEMPLSPLNKQGKDEVSMIRDYLPVSPELTFFWFSSILFSSIYKFKCIVSLFTSSIWS
jgi:hypothetical protein